MILIKSTSRLLSLSLALLILFFEVLDASLQLPIVFLQTVHVCQDHILDLLEFIRILNLVDILFKLLMHKVRHVVNAGAVDDAGEIEALAQILILNRQLKVRLHGILVLLRHTQQVFSQLHIANQNFFNDTYAGNETIL